MFSKVLTTFWTYRNIKPEGTFPWAPNMEVESGHFLIYLDLSGPFCITHPSSLLNVKFTV